MTGRATIGQSLGFPPVDGALIHTKPLAKADLAFSEGFPNGPNVDLHSLNLCILHSRRQCLRGMGRKRKPVDREMAARLLKARQIDDRFKFASEAARAMGVPEPTYLGHENGSRGFDVQEAGKYARFYKVDPTWLLYAIGNPRGLSIQDKVAALSPARRKAVEEHIDLLLELEAKDRAARR